VEVANNKIAIMQYQVYDRVCQYQPCKPSKREAAQEPQHKEYGRYHVGEVRPQRQQPVQQFNACRNSYNGGARSKVRSRVYIKADNKHMVPPNYAAEQANQEERYKHGVSAKYDELREFRDYGAN
jgi:hypothetical protein